MKKSLLALVALVGMPLAYAADVTKDNFGDNLSGDIILDDVSSSFDGGTFAVSFEVETLLGLDLNLQMGNGKEYPDGESFYVSIASGPGYLMMSALGANLTNGMLYPLPDYSGTFVVQSIRNDSDISVTLNHFDGQNYTLVHSITTSASYFPSEINVAKFTVAAGSTTVSELRTWTGEVTVEDIKNPPPAGSVPEPATATLSLLALAGLAARRRRH